MTKQNDCYLVVYVTIWDTKWSQDDFVVIQM